VTLQDRAKAFAVPERLPGVGHYDFFASCTDAAKAAVPQCKIDVPQADTHRRAIAAAEAFFTRNLDARR
jgi:hypothetical protein